VTFLDLLSACFLIVDFSFNAMLCSNLGNKNSDAAILCSCVPQAPHPCSRPLLFNNGPYDRHNQLVFIPSNFATEWCLMLFQNFSDQPTSVMSLLVFFH